ncbi:class I SAM-dependent methyltransferase [Lysobacter olei]
MPALLKALGIVGSDVDNFECPRCGAHDRERHLLLYLTASGLLKRIPGMRVLHFAPERCLARIIAGLGPVEYIKCDKYPTGDEMMGVDIESMPFPDGSFDLVIANHVLEHVDDDLLAVREIHRVLRKDGSAVLQTPYCRDLTSTWRDPGIIAAEARLQAYGQEDHVRLFGSDVFERISSSGLLPCVETHENLLAEYDATVCGVNASEPFFHFRRCD